MSLSEADAEKRLAALRRQRELLDREIADLVLYLELGRRLNATGAATGAGEEAAPTPSGERSEAGLSRPSPEQPVVTGPARSSPPSEDAEAVPPEPIRRRPSLPQPVAFTDDPAGARHYGRLLIEAACEAIAAAGRPLHAREIVEILQAHGLTVPGRDPVAAMNTRLWKRAGEGGPLRRHGEAVYGLAKDGSD